MASEVCRNCGKRLEEKEYICSNCLEIIDLEKHEQIVDERVQKIGKIEQVEEKDGYIACKKCGASVKVGEPKCTRCEHILSEKLYEIYVEEYRKNSEQAQVNKKSIGLQLACLLLPFVGIIMWLKYRKRDPLLAKLCIDSWWSGSFRLRLIIIILVAAGITAIF